MKVSLERSLPVEVVLGTQWGDEGKGKVVDLLAGGFDWVARFQGGHNAGHTVEYGGETFILHLIPTGILRPQVRCAIGNGVVIDPEYLLNEIDTLESRGLEVKKRVFLSTNAHLILAYHTAMEKASEQGRGSTKIGTTGRGIGPAYADKADRIGIRLGDLADTKILAEKVKTNVAWKNRILEKVLKAPVVNEKDILDGLLRFRERIMDRIVDTGHILREALSHGEKILVEGAQGALLDIDFGTYPYVTSSSTTLGGAAIGLGLPIRSVNRVIGVLKAYTTRVGNGPFPTELTGEFGERIREIGSEYGATTGRPRRCGWFDGFLARYAVEISGMDVLAVTKLDVLDGLDEIRVCTGYRYKGKGLESFPTDAVVLDGVEPVYETVPGWKEPLSGIRKFKNLPPKARAYLARLEKLVGVPVGLVSVGSGREETIWK